MECSGLGLKRRPLVSGALVCILFTPLLGGALWNSQQKAAFPRPSCLLGPGLPLGSFDANGTPTVCSAFQPPVTALELANAQGSSVVLRPELVFTLGCWSLKALLLWQLSDVFKQVFYISSIPPVVLARKSVGYTLIHLYQTFPSLGSRETKTGI